MASASASSSSSSITSMVSSITSMEKSWAISDIEACMPLMFKEAVLTYGAWCELFKSYCGAYGVIDHIQEDSDPKLDDPEWNRIDSIVKLWMYTTIAATSRKPLMAKRNTTARQVWINFDVIMSSKKLGVIAIGDSSITDYCDRIKTIADHLEKIGHTVPEDKLVFYTLNGLSPKFSCIAKVIHKKRSRSPPPSFLEARAVLLLEEYEMSNTFMLLKNLLVSPHVIPNHKDPRYLKAAQVYQVLSDGENGESDDTMVDSGDIFGMLYCTRLFEDYIGQLYLAQKMKVQEKMSLREFQKEREVKLIAILKNRLRPFVKGQTEKFINYAELEARRLSKSFYGKALSHTIGYIYTSEAARELGKHKLFMVPFLVECVTGMHHRTKSDSSAISGYVSLMKIHNKLKKLNNSQQMMKVVEEKIDEISNSLWQMIVIDIEETLCTVCRSLFKDPKVSKDEMEQLAIGMKKLGMILQVT